MNNLPMRGDAVEAWLEEKRDEHQERSAVWYALEDVLHEYQMKANDGTVMVAPELQGVS